ncbi:MAG: PucR family transcriptional regulator [Bacillota bacterium]|jgi:purine catabolism regulator
MSLTVKEALEINGLNRAIVVAGHQGLENEIKFVNIMEVPEVVRWLRGGELLVTAGYAFQKDPLVRKTLIYNLARKKIAAFGIKPGQYLTEVPRDMIQYADEVGLPILELPPDLPYHEIMLPIFEILINKQVCRLKRWEEVHNRLLEVLLNGGGFANISRCLRDLVKNPVLILDGAGNLLAAAVEGGGKTQLGEFLAIWENFRNSLLRFTPNRSHRLDCLGEQIRQSLILVPIKVIGTVNGYLVALESREKMDEQDLRAVEHAATIVALEFAKERAVFEAEKQIKGELLEDLVTGSFHYEEMVIRRASFLNFNLQAPLAVFVVDMNGLEKYLISEGNRREDHIHKFKSLILGICHHTLLGYPGGAMLQMKSDRIIGLVRAMDENDEKLLREKCQEICRQLEKMCQKVRVSIGIGRTYKGVRNIKKSYEEALISLRIGRFLSGSAGVTFFQDLGSYRFLYELKDSESMRSFQQEYLGNLKLYDAQNQTELVKTLICYLKNNGNLRRTAEEMFIHKNSVLYRIKKIEEITGLKLNDPEDRFNFHLSLKLDQIK